MRKYVSKLTNDLRGVSRDAPIISRPVRCAGMLRHEAHEILEMDTPELTDVGSRMAGTSSGSCFAPVRQGRAGYQPAHRRHHPCRACRSQVPGRKAEVAIELARLIPGVTVKRIRNDLAVASRARTV